MEADGDWGRRMMNTTGVSAKKMQAMKRKSSTNAITVFLHLALIILTNGVA